MPKRPRIGISPDNERRDGNPSRPFYFLDAQNFVALKKADALPFMLVHDLDAIPDYLEALDGVMISGGGYQFPDPIHLIPPRTAGGHVPEEKRARTEFEIALIQAALERDLPVLAVCGGVQTLNAALGGKLVVNLAETNPEWAKHRSPPYDSIGHDVVVEKNSLLHRLVRTERMPVNSLHRQGIIDVGPGIIASAKAEDGVVEAIEDPSRRFCLGVQWHPEFAISPADQLIFDGFCAVCRG